MHPHLSRRWLVGIALLGAAASPAHGVTLAELSWNSRLGAGTIVYDRDVLDAIAGDGRGSFLDAVHSFDLYGLRLPYGNGGISLKGTGGSILTQDTPKPCNYFQTCAGSSVVFLLGRAIPDDPLSYRVSFNFVFGLDRDDLIPVPEFGGLPTYEDRWNSGSILNELGSPNYSVTTLSWPGGISHRLLPAPPVPEPGTLALFGAGALVLAAARRRR